MGMLLYAAVFMLLIVIGMRVLWDVAAEYEVTRDKYAIEEYLSSMDEDHIDALAESFMNSLDTAIQNPEESRSAVARVMQGELRYVRQPGESSTERAVFKIYGSGRELGKVVFTKAEEKRFGMSRWQFAEESYDFSWLCGSDSITVPVDWRVSIGGNELDDSYVTENTIPYEYLKDFYGKGLPELYQKTVEIDNYVGSAPFEIVDSFGRPVSREELSEERFLDNCTDAEKAADEAFIQAFLPYYVECLANTRRDATGNYNNISRYLVSGSDLDVRLRGAIAGQYWAHSQGEQILSITLDRHVHLGDDIFLVEFSYELESKSGNTGGTTKSDNHAQIILRLTDGTLRAQAIYSL